MTTNTASTVHPSATVTVTKEKPICAANFPVLDVQNDAPAVFVEKLRDACENYGFFLLKNSNVTLDLQQQSFNGMRDFFGLSDEEKRKVKAQTPSLGMRGYNGMGQETLGTNQSEGDTKEGYYVWGCGDPYNVWPDASVCATFQPAMERYLQAVTDCAYSLLPYFEQALGLEAGYFMPFFSPATAVLRPLQYSLKPSDVEKGVFGAGAHTDYGFLTLLATDGSKGLQIKPRGQCTNQNVGDVEGRHDEEGWIDVPYVPNTLVINLGDMLERWTSRRFVSTLHRVVIRSDGNSCTAAAAADGAVEPVHHRRSIPFFFEPNADAIITSIPMADTVAVAPKKAGADASPSSPAAAAVAPLPSAKKQYAPIRYGTYLAAKYAGTYTDD